MERHPKDPYGGGLFEPPPIKILNWVKSVDGGLSLEVECNLPVNCSTAADEFPAIISAKGREFQKWGLDQARRVVIYRAAPPPSDSSHAE